MDRQGRQNSAIEHVYVRGSKRIKIEFFLWRTCCNRPKRRVHRHGVSQTRLSRNAHVRWIHNNFGLSTDGLPSSSTRWFLNDSLVRRGYIAVGESQWQPHKCSRNNNNNNIRNIIRVARGTRGMSTRDPFEEPTITTINRRERGEHSSRPYTA